MSGLGACDSKFGGKLIPAVRIPPNIIPALPNFYATAHVLDGYATGSVVKHIMGRPVQVDGNPTIPASLGASDVFAQAQLLDFYDPDRAGQIIAGRALPPTGASLSRPSPRERAALAANGGRAFGCSPARVTSPTLARAARCGAASAIRRRAGLSGSRSRATPCGGAPSSPMGGRSRCA